MLATATGCKVILADDNRDAVDTLTLVLHSAGHHVQADYSGREVLELATHVRPDVLTLDIGMPEMNGYEIARPSVRRHGAAMPC